MANQIVFPALVTTDVEDIAARQKRVNRMIKLLGKAYVIYNKGKWTKEEPLMVRIQRSNVVYMIDSAYLTKITNAITHEIQELFKLSGKRRKTKKPAGARAKTSNAITGPIFLDSDITEWLGEQIRQLGGSERDFPSLFGSEYGGYIYANHLNKLLNTIVRYTADTVPGVKNFYSAPRHMLKAYDPAIRRSHEKDAQHPLLSVADMKRMIQNKEKIPNHKFQPGFFNFAQLQKLNHSSADPRFVVVDDNVLAADVVQKRVEAAEADGKRVVLVSSLGPASDPFSFDTAMKHQEDSLVALRKMLASAEDVPAPRSPRSRRGSRSSRA